MQDEDSEFYKISRQLRELQQEKIIGLELLRHLVKEKIITDEILSSLSHELRTPIVSIKGYTDMLLKYKFGKLLPEQKQKLEIIKDSTDELIHAILDILDKKQKFS